VTRGTAEVATPAIEDLAMPPARLGTDRQFWLIVASLTVIYITAVYFSVQRLSGLMNSAPLTLPGRPPCARFGSGC
jgi:hypothetical protein